ncbi:MAG: insulinase family protein [Chloroflexi bacterium]|nr:insulinase family protein [Chloroflexota bacterium]
MYQKSTLDNGLRVLSAQMPHARSVSIVMGVATGARYEPAGVNGVSHFIEHMLFKGTERRPSPKLISEAIEGVGGIINAETGKEHTMYWAKVAREHLPLALDLLSDLLLCSQFAPEEIEKERRVILEELHMLLDEPHEWVDVLFDQTLWGEHPLGRDIVGTRETLTQMDRRQIVGFYRQRYDPRATVVSVAGAVEHDAVVDRVATMMGGWSGEVADDELEPPAELCGPRVLVQPKDTEQAHLCLGVRALSYRDPERYALNLLNAILGEGMSSRLFLEIRERQGLAYDVHSYTSHFRDAGTAIIYAGVEPADLLRTVEALMGELRRLREPVPDEELRRAREFKKGRLALAMEDTRAIASWIGGQELLHGRPQTFDEIVEIVDSLTADDLQRVANRCFSSDRLALAVVGPYAEPPPVRDLLAL